MADNLLGGLLGYGNRLRSNLRGLLGDPVTYANEALGNALPSMEELAAQARQMGQTGQVPANVDPRIMDLGMGLLGAIKVYHGSPYKFTKASSEHIGKGEGAQAYGHGLYWAEKPEVAQDYAWNLSQRSPDRIKYNDKALSPNTMLARAIEDVGLVGKESALQKIDDSIKFNEKYSPDTASLYKSIREIIKDVDPAKVDVNKGNLYEASLRWPDAAREAADPLGPQHFLDWDKPLSEQPNVINALKQIGAVQDDVLLRPTGGKAVSDSVGQSAYTSLQAIAHHRPDLISGGDKGISDFLRQSGIPGITYLDAGSRAAGQGTRNYVTFDDALVELLKRNGISLAGQ